MTAREEERSRRKHEVLTHGTPSSVRTIAEAVVIKDEALFFLSDRHGDVPIEGEHGYGLYRHDCRFLRGYELRLGEERAEALAASAARGFGASLQLTNPALDRHEVPEDRVSIEWERVIDEERSMLRDQIVIRNNGVDATAFPLSFRFRADFEDVFIVRGLLEVERGTLHEPRWIDDRLVFAYDGLDDVRRVTVISLLPRPERAGDVTAIYDLRLDPDEEVRFDVAIAVSECSSSGSLAEHARKIDTGDLDERVRVRQLLERATESWVSEHVHMDSDSLVLNAVFDRSMRDLGMMTTRLNERRFYAAGLPWFATLFGRDSGITSLQSLAFVPEIAEDTLRLLAQHQGRRDDEWSDEQPGKILHELRVGELANAGLVPYRPYFGSVDATSLFLILLVRHAWWTGSLSLLDELGDAVAAARDWILRHCESPEGFIAYDSRVDGGIVNQGWKDSGDAMVDESGGLAEPPIALIEVQCYAYRALSDLAGLLRSRGRTEGVERLERRARELRQRIDERFWCEEIGTYAMALAKGSRPLAVSSSNAGHALWSGVPDESRAQRIVDRLMTDDMFSGWGVRTLSADAAAYSPVGYHLGTVWPHDNAIIAAGCRWYGCNDAALRILEGMLSAAMSFEHSRLPEVFAGFSRREYGVPVRYPVACHPQAWAASSVPGMIDALLGFEPDGFNRTLRLVRPTLPPFVTRIDLKGLRVGDQVCDLRMVRRDGKVEVDRSSGDGIEVLVEHS